MADTTATKSPQQSEAHYKETVESILVAFILAFIFRAFVVEAFVIPTGSMAPTLFGAHTRFHCPDCGYVFDIGMRTADSESDEIDIPAEVERSSNSTIHCPNCGYDFPSSTSMHKISDPVRFGDRILVLKYLYLFEKPRRWDVVVFKSPSEKHHVAKDPEYGQNYIKRLIGNPNESIVILDGDVYVAPGAAKGLESDDSGAALSAEAKSFAIQRKPAYVQERLWRSAYDNDFVPHGQQNRSTVWHQPWQVADGAGWNVGSDARPSRAFHFDDAAHGGSVFFRSNANSYPDNSSLSLLPLKDWMAYDEKDNAGHNWVSDLKVSCFYTRKSGAGPFRVYLTKLDQCFTAEFTPGNVTLYRSTIVKSADADTGQGFDPGQLHRIDSAEMPALAGNVPVQIDFSNCDYRVTLRVDGKDVFKPYEYDPDTLTLWRQALNDTRDPFARPEIRMSVERQVSTIEHVSLWHDIYYGNNGIVPDSEGHQVPFWASPRNVLHLNAGEYFVLGDNSPISGDARYWFDPIYLPHENLSALGGRVPEQFMLGKAFFVYWPAGYPLPYVHFNSVPDFGEMRFIH